MASDWTECPACGGPVRRLTMTRGPVLGEIFWHSTGRPDGTCFGWTYTRAADAWAVQRIREEGGERLRLAAHP